MEIINYCKSKVIQKINSIIYKFNIIAVAELTIHFNNRRSIKLHDLNYIISSGPIVLYFSNYQYSIKIF